ncbi:hypothetical protein [Flavobacterium salmonis]|uniref:Uncharacterized protein n=1 Tax=Flavobacterium salmonis TaxID=2654844 RepID=A0A6V6YV69_9FLAO|nr:hypothetical protein [Flavobacterium salmonis]CAD0003355.1 hypothetical protein FLAT13_01638 [Flavobacterium salmonis]
MSNKIKNISIIINLLILVLAIFWIKKSNFDYEPITVVCGQSLSLIVLVFGESIQNKFFVKDVSKSKVNFDIDKEDKGEYNISNITDSSEIRIKKR